MMKNIFIDCQILQTEAFDRGMGKYSLSLLTALSLNKNFTNKYKVTLVLNKNLRLKKSNKNAIFGVFSKPSLLEVDLPTNIVDNLNEKYLEAEKELTKALKNISDQGDVYLILAPFFVKFPAVFPALPNIKKAAIIYDLIPYLVWNKMRIFPDDVYFKHYQLFMQADILLTISNTVKSDIVSILGIHPDKIISIDGGPFLVDTHSSTPKLTKRPYVLCVSAPILHKNNDRAVEAFARFNKLNNNRFDLVFTSSFDDATKKRLKNISGNLIFSGNVSDDELYWLYENAKSILFASLTEGLGLPVLEGVLHNKPIACSDIPVLREISSEAFYMFNPVSVAEMSSAIADSVTRVNFKVKNQKYKGILKKFSWERSAQLLNEGLGQKSTKTQLNKKLIKVFAPDPRTGNVEGKLFEKLYPRLIKKYDVEVEFIKNKKNNSPAYLPYIVDESFGNRNRELDEVIIFGYSPTPQKNTPTLRVIVTQKNIQNLKNSLLYKNVQIDLKYKANIKILYPEIGFRSYDFYNKNNRPASLEQIFEDINLMVDRKSYN